MKASKWLGGFVVGCALAALATAVAQDKGERPSAGQPSAQDVNKAMQEWMKLAAPGENHARLEHFVGKWQTTHKMWPGGPGSEPMISKGTAEVQWILDGHYVQETIECDLMGSPFKGLGITGYDNFRNVYVTMWLDNMGTQMLTAVGAVNQPAGKVFRYYGEMDEPGLQIVGRMYKSVTRIVNDDQHVFEMYDLHVADDYKVMEIVYDRKK